MNGDGADVPQITTAADWHVGFGPGPGDDPSDAPRHKPDYCLNLGLTWPGLVALELEARVLTLSFESFGAFIEGAARRAELVGDTGASSPTNWVGGVSGRGDDHVLVTLYALNPEAMTSYSDRLYAWFVQRDAFREISRHDGMALMEMRDGRPVPTAKVHFGYTDGISTPAHHSRRSASTTPGITSSHAIPWLLRLAGRGPELHGSRTARTWPQRRALAVFKKVETDVVEV